MMQKCLSVMSSLKRHIALGFVFLSGLVVDWGPASSRSSQVDFSVFYFIYFYVMYVGDLTLCLREVVRSHETGVIDSCEPPCGCWELHPHPQEDQLVLLTTEPFLQPLTSRFWNLQ